MSVIDITGDGKLTKEIITEGTGAQPKDGEKVEVHYTGTLTDGTEFDSSRSRGSPFSFTIGTGVIKGWSLGVATMKVGERAKFTIDSELGYGKGGSPPKIPADATLIFDIELLKIAPPSKKKEEAIAEANALCATAADSFKAGDFQAAVDSYLAAQEAIKSKYGKEIDDLKLRLNRNLAVAYAKVANWRQALVHADKVLEKEAGDLRALHRKAEAHTALADFADARKAIDKGLAATKGESTNAVFVKLRADLESAEKLDRIREAELFKKMTRKTE
jgi:peptidylprolyl isomerase